MYNLKNQILYSLDSAGIAGRTVEGIIADIRTNGEIHNELLHPAFVKVALDALIEEGHVRSYQVCGGDLTAWRLSA